MVWARNKPKLHDAVFKLDTELGWKKELSHVCRKLNTLIRASDQALCRPKRSVRNKTLHFFLRMSASLLWLSFHSLYLTWLMEIAFFSRLRFLYLFLVCIIVLALFLLPVRCAWLPFSAFSSHPLCQYTPHLFWQPFSICLLPVS